MSAAGNFNFRRIAPFPSLQLDAELTAATSLFTNGRPTVVHFYNGG
jgi:hypothetical protein